MDPDERSVLGLPGPLRAAHRHPPVRRGPPEPNQRPTLQRDEFPESYAPDAVERLAGVFARALSPVAAERPPSAAAAIVELDGLIVLAVPGGIHEDRVCLNEKYNLPYTPDMTAVYLEAKAR